MTVATPRRLWTVLAAFALCCSVVVGLVAETPSADATVPGLVGRIAFAADIDGGVDIWVRDFASNSPVNVTGNLDEERQPAWSPDGTKLAYASYGWLTGTGTIVVIDDTGGNAEFLTSATNDDWWPSWSRDGRSIVYTSNEDGPDQDIWVVDVDSKVRTNLTPDSAADDSQPEWSPDGSHIVFVSDRSGNSDIWTMAADGSGAVNLTAAAASDWAPSWSPDGSQIAFVSDRASVLGDVHVMDSNGTNVVRRTVDAEVLGRAAWSPDGTLIGFTSIKDGDLDVWMVAAAGSSSPSHLTNHVANEYEVAWESVNRPPTAVEDIFDVGPLESFTGNLLGNDFDPDGDQLTVVDVATQTLRGTLTWVGDGSFTYTLPYSLKDLCPDLFDQALYVIEDGRLAADSVDIYFNVELPPGLPPAPDGPEVGEDDARISVVGPEGATEFGAEEPVTIYNPTANEYLVVWSADHHVDGEYEIWGRRLGASGTKLGSQLRLTNYGAVGFPGSVAGVFGLDEYLLVWWAFGGDHPEIHGLRVGTDGSVISPGVFPISPSVPGGTVEYDFPAVAYNSTDDEYLVVWGGSLGGPDQVYGQFLAGDGQPLGSMFEVSTDDPGPGWIVQPDVAYNPVDNQYLVVWSGNPANGILGPSEYEIFARRLDADGSPLDPVASRISHMGPDGNGDFDAQNAAVAHNPIANEFLVVWRGSDDATGFGPQHSEVFAQRLSATGMQLAPDDLRISEMNHTGWPRGTSWSPAIAFDSANNEFLVVWQGADAPFPCEGYEIFGQRLSAAGTELGAEDFRVSHNQVGPAWAEAHSPDLAYNPANGEYLVVWRGDYLSPGGPIPGEYEVHGQRLATNRAPLTEPDEVTVLEGGSISGDVLDNDSDPEGDALTASKTSDPAHGTVDLASDGSFTYEHDGSETTSDSFTYQASDGSAVSTDTTVTVTVTPVNDPPVGEPDTFTVLEAGTVTGNVTDNDSDPDGDSLSAQLVTSPSHGTLRSWGSGGAFTYEHDGSETTSDSFTYRATDGFAQSPVTEVAIAVTPVNDLPRVWDSTQTTYRGGRISGTVPGYGIDPEGDPVTAQLVTDASHGELTLEPNGSYTYQHDGSSAKEDSFEYRLSDGWGWSNVARLTITIAAGHTWGLVDPTTGAWYVTTIEGVWNPFYYGVPGDLPMVGDWDCDGEETPGLYRQSDGYVYLRNRNSTGVADIRFHLGIPGDIPLAGDFDGDGCDTVSVYRPSEGRVFISNQLGGNDGFFVADYEYYFGIPGDKPFCGDFNADGIETIGLHREASGLVYFRQSHTLGVADAEFFFGIPGDRLISGDWGFVDGVYTMGLFRPANHTIYLRWENTQGTANVETQTGKPDWLPIAGCISPACAESG